MKKILITGASGFVGSRASVYFKEWYQVMTPDHREMDITDPASVRAVMEQFRPDGVIHCAAISDVGQCQKNREQAWAINTMGAVHVAQAAGEVGARCLLASSDQVYVSSTVETPHEETEPVEPGNIYGQGKLAAEEKCLEVNPDCVLLRLSWMYDRKTLSDREHLDLIRTLVPKLKRGEPAVFSAWDKRGITDVNEVVSNMENAFVLPGGVYNFGAPNDCDTYRMMKRIFKALGMDEGLLQNAEPSDRVRNLCMSQKKLRSFGISFRPTEEGLLTALKQEMGV